MAAREESLMFAERGFTVNPDRVPVAARIWHEVTDTWNDKIAFDQFTGRGRLPHPQPGTHHKPEEATVDPADALGIPAVTSVGSPTRPVAVFGGLADGGDISASLDPGDRRRPAR